MACDNTGGECSSCLEGYVLQDGNCSVDDDGVNAPLIITLCLLFVALVVIGIVTTVCVIKKRKNMPLLPNRTEMQYTEPEINLT